MFAPKMLYVNFNIFVNYFKIRTLTFYDNTKTSLRLFSTAIMKFSRF